MKPRLILVAATMLSSAFASDITLSDGRFFKEATVTSETPRKVVIKHSNGLTSVSKQQLPADLQAKYPVNEAAAQAAEEKAVLAREAALQARQAETQSHIKLRAEREAEATANAAAAKEAAAARDAQLSLQKQRAKSALQQYFLETFSWNPSAERIVEVSITDIQATEGWADRWTVTGRAIINNYQHSTKAVNVAGMSSREASQAEYRAAQKTTETRVFTADYSPNSSTPLNVTLR